ncbi:hypothetical protein DEA8626_00354 [Defluviimonas aquaemixtae]|uniref:Uncharacterized protein n=1 Tax=Albidovulum aquaemixtae TaxID=1542388 RepID=A0A2R8B2R6_9RHOB|nr:hypothetical protein DEA8626_00354 [Defluviimonas aquaemixtae]
MRRTLQGQAPCRRAEEAWARTGVGLNPPQDGRRSGHGQHRQVGPRIWRGRGPPAGSRPQRILSGRSTRAPEPGPRAPRVPGSGRSLRRTSASIATESIALPDGRSEVPKVPAARGSTTERKSGGQGGLRPRAHRGPRRRDGGVGIRHSLRDLSSLVKKQRFPSSPGFATVVDTGAKPLGFEGIVPRQPREFLPRVAGRVASRVR